MPIDSILQTFFKSDLRGGKIFLPNSVHTNACHLALRNSELSLIDWDSKSDAFMITLDTSKAELPLRLKQVMTRVEILDLDFTARQQTVDLNISLIKATSDQLLVQIAIWISLSMFSALVQETMDKNLPLVLDGTEVKAESTGSPGIFHVDLSGVATVQKLVSMRPIPFVNKGPLDVMQVTGCQHVAGGLNVMVVIGF